MQLPATLITLALITGATAQTILYRRVNANTGHTVAAFNQEDWYSIRVGTDIMCSSTILHKTEVKGLSLTSNAHEEAIGRGRNVEVKHTTDAVINGINGLRAVHDGIPFPEHWTLTVTQPMRCNDLMHAINGLPWVGPVKRKTIPKTTKRSEHAMNRVRMVNEAVGKRQLEVEELD